MNLINEFSEALPNTDYELQGLLSRKLCEIQCPKNLVNGIMFSSLFGKLNLKIR